MARIFYPHNLQGIQRGDIVVMHTNTWRNNGKLIWDGQKGVPLCYEEDDYGHSPAEFTCPEEFPIMHWQVALVHSLIPVNIEKRTRELIKNMSELLEWSEDTKFVITAFLCNEQCYRILFVSPCRRDVIKLLKKSKYLLLSYRPAGGISLPLDDKTLYKIL